MSQPALDIELSFIHLMLTTGKGREGKGSRSPMRASAGLDIRVWHKFSAMPACVLLSSA